MQPAFSERVPICIAGRVWVRLALGGSDLNGDDIVVTAEGLVRVGPARVGHAPAEAEVRGGVAAHTVADARWLVGVGEQGKVEVMSELPQPPSGPIGLRVASVWMPDVEVAKNNKGGFCCSRCSGTEQGE